MEPQNLITRLQNDVQQIIETVETELLSLEKSALNQKPAPEKWSALECFEHLNRYNRFYNPELERALEHKGKAVPFRPGWLGNYFVQSVVPENAKPMKTMAHLNPSSVSQLGVKVLEEFLGHQRHLLELLTKAKGANLNRRAVRVEVFRLLRIKTGDAFRFVVAHQQRHLQQALRVVEVMV
ncbi:MAG: DinB family protein [Phaeodactylibacter sp.]|nr:DinB family protein [Phaeodactylibacter sp.]